MSILEVSDLGLQHYGPVWDLQRSLHKRRVEGRQNDILLLVEHYPVYTIGKNGKKEHILASSDYLKKENIAIYQVDRGGDVTYHGPGQLVGYPILNLQENHLGIDVFLRKLEEIFIRILKEYGIDSHRIYKYTGVWVGEEKILAIGIRVSHWTTMHGFAFNVKPNLSHFLGIIPCGIKGKGTTSLARLLHNIPPMKEIKEKVILNFCQVMGFKKWKLVGGEVWNSLTVLARKNS